MLKRILTVASALLPVAGAAAQLPLDTELLVNGDFETGDLTGWTPVQGGALVQGYGTNTSVAPFAVSVFTGGGLFLVSDFNGNTILRQTFDLSANPGPLAVKLAGYFGGSAADDDRAFLLARFEDGSSQELDTLSIGNYTRANRNNGENVLIRDEGVMDIPAAATSLIIELHMPIAGGSADGAADTLSAMIVAPEAPQTPQLNTQLLADPGFEQGWTTGSYLDLNNPNGWRGASNSAANTAFWGTGGVPPVAVGLEIGGGNFALSDTNGSARLVQTFDVSGLSTQINSSQLSVELGGYFGGSVDDNDGSSLQVAFFNPIGARINLDILEIGSEVNRAWRNRESVIMRREGAFPIPPGTTSIEVAAQMIITGGAADGCMDNLSFRIVPTEEPPALPLGENIIVNGDFEEGWLGNSYLSLNDPGSWFGTSDQRSFAKNYGAAMPASVQQAVSGGDRYLGDFSGASRVRQVFDLTGNRTLVDQGFLAVQIDGFLGGDSADNDTARMEVSFLNQFGGPLDSQQVDGPGGGPTLVPREITAIIPPGTRTMLIDMVMIITGGSADGAADNITAVLFDTTLGGPGNFPGTDEDLRLFTGISGETPSTGPAFDSKEAVPGDFVTMRVSSPESSFNFSPMLLYITVFPNGTTPTLFPGLLGVWNDPLWPTFFIARNNNPAFNPILGPNGSEYVVFIPDEVFDQSLLIQGGVLPTLALPPFAPSLPANGFYATTDAHLIEIR